MKLNQTYPLMDLLDALTAASDNTRELAKQLKAEGHHMTVFTVYEAENMLSAHDLPGDLGQVRGQQRADRAAQQSEQDQIDHPSIQRVIDAQVQTKLHINADGAEQQQAAEPRLPQAAAEGLRRFRRLARRLRVIQYLNLIGFCLQHICLLPQASLRGRRLRNLSKYWRGAYHTVNVKKLQ